MSGTGDLTGVDMNNATNLGFFSEIIVFKNDASRDELIFKNRSNPEQRTLQMIAHSLSLEYEYTAATKAVRISRPADLEILFSENISHKDIPASVLPTTHDASLDSVDSNLPITASDECINSLLNLDSTCLGFSMPMPGNQIGAFEMWAQIPIPPRSYRQEATLPVQAVNLQARLLSPDHISQELDSLVTAQTNSNIDKLCHQDSPAIQNPIDFFLQSMEQNYPLCLTCGQSTPVCSCYASFGYTRDWELSPSVIECSTIDRQEKLLTRPNNLITDQQRELSLVSNSTTSLATVANREKILTGLHLQIDTEHHQMRSEAELSHTPESGTDEDVESLKPYQCDLCPRRFFRSNQIGRHRRIMHREAKRRFFCSSCVLSFDRLMALTRHRLSCKLDGASESSVGGQYGSTSNGNNSTSICKGSGFNKIVFDSVSTYSSGSSSSASSAGSGRQGPLSKLVRQGMREVKKVGACWRCKFRKKSCENHTPCTSCLEDGKTYWEGIGCRRGDFQAVNFDFCGRTKASTVDVIHDVESKIRAINFESDNDALLSRNEFKGFFGSSAQVFSEESRLRQQFHENLPSLDHSPMASINLGILKHRALAIIWNLLRSAPGRDILHGNGSLGGLATLLPFAVAYQAENDNDQLVAQSLVCLRTCAEVLRIKQAGLLAGQWHRNCGRGCCEFECIGKVNKHLSQYLKELSQVFFHEKNLQRRQNWSLSVFYSFCIQSYVRRILIDLTKNWELCFFYEDSLSWPWLDNFPNAPAKLQAAFTQFCDGLEMRILRSSSPESHIQSPGYQSSTEIWRKLPTNKRKVHLKQALSTFSNPIRKLTPNPLRQAQARFDSMLQRFKISSEMSLENVVALDLKVHRAADKIEAERYLHLPVRLSRAVNRGAPEVLHDEQPRTNSSPKQHHIHRARKAVAYSDWPKQGIMSCWDYLREIFQDNGSILQDISAIDDEDPVAVARLDSMFHDYEIPSCKICLGFVHLGSPLAVLPCSHWFHETCIVAWLQEINICPTCDVEVYDEDTSGLVSSATEVGLV